MGISIHTFWIVGHGNLDLYLLNNVSENLNSHILKVIREFPFTLFSTRTRESWFTFWIVGHENLHSRRFNNVGENLNSHILNKNTGISSHAFSNKNMGISIHDRNPGISIHAFHGTLNSRRLNNVGENLNSHILNKNTRESRFTLFQQHGNLNSW